MTPPRAWYQPAWTATLEYCRLGARQKWFSCFVRLEVYDQGASVAGVWLGLSPWGTGGLSPVLAWQQTSLFPFL